MFSRLAHQAFFLDDDEKTRAVELPRRVEDFSGVIVLAYAIMSNHFHIFIYVPEPEEISDEEILRRINALYRESSLAQVLGEWTRLRDDETSPEGACRAGGGESGKRSEKTGRRFCQEGRTASEGGSRARDTEEFFRGVGARRFGGRGENPGAAGRRSDETCGASPGGVYQ